MVESSRDEPVPRWSVVTGDHFNRKLFVVRGLSGPDARILPGLESQVHELNRGATWVLLIVDSVMQRRSLPFAPRSSRPSRVAVIGLGWAWSDIAAAIAGVDFKALGEIRPICEQIYHTAVTGGFGWLYRLGAAFSIGLRVGRREV